MVDDKNSKIKYGVNNDINNNFDKEFNAILIENKINILDEDKEGDSSDNDEYDNNSINEKFIDTENDDDRISTKHNKIKGNINKYATISGSLVSSINPFIIENKK